LRLGSRMPAGAGSLITRVIRGIRVRVIRVRVIRVIRVIVVTS
jgi:hypothetical protein